MRAFTLSQIINLLNGEKEASSIDVKGYCVDSRRVKPGEIFFALSGEKVDGHHFLYDAKQRGAIAAVVSEKYSHLFPEDFLLICVEDPLEALQNLAKFSLSLSNSRIVAITGSVGKTTTKEFIFTLLSGSYTVAVSPGNYNSQIGLPLTILNHTSGQEDVIVLEMGMTNSGQISKLISIAPPEVALITSVELVHACNFNSIEQIARSKAEIFESIHTKLGIMDYAIPNFAEISQATSCPKVSFSLIASQADYSRNSQSTDLYSKLENKKIDVSSFTVSGKHNQHNLLAAIAVARYFNIDWNIIQQRLAHLKLPERRLQYLECEGIVFINDSYNAAEPSVKAALESMPQPTSTGRKIAVLGSMMELGSFSHDCHLRVGEHALSCVDEFYCFGEECQPIVECWQKASKPTCLFSDFLELVEFLKKHLQVSDVVLLKGSSSKQMWKILDAFSQ